MTSTRLPGKVLLKTAGKTVLEHHIDRLKWSGIPIYLATTINKSDDIVADLAAQLSIPIHRGDENNVLQRFHQCAEKYELEVIIRVTSDCPLIDGYIIQDALQKYLQEGNLNVYYSNALVRTFPRGLDFEIFSSGLLQHAYSHAQTAAEHEHVTPYINQNRSGNVLLKHYTSPQDNSDQRWTLDTEDDWKLIDHLFEQYGVAHLDYTAILEIIRTNPELQKINSHVKQKDIKL